MTQRRKIEIYSAGCPLCDEAVQLVRQIAGSAHDIQVLDVTTTATFHRARELGVQSVPAVAIDGRLAACCTNGGVQEDVLRASILDQPSEPGTTSEERSGRPSCC